jgi:hypothetical protein
MYKDLEKNKAKTNTIPAVLCAPAIIWSKLIGS